MDVSRAVLENLMGRDRNKCKDNITERDHYSNPDVCKPFLVCFCFNTLFPNTIYDQGPCNKRHDTYLKSMFDNDLHRSDYQKQYIKQCIRWIQRRLIDVKQKTNKNQGVIDNKSNFPTDRPKQILDRIMAIDQDIQKMMIQAQMYGQKGQIDDSARCLEQVQRLRDRRKEIQLMGNDLMNAAKQQKICEICGAIQTINDTQKRIQTHLQGKIHQGFLKLRHQIQSLKIRLQILTKLDPHHSKRQKQEHENQNNHHNQNSHQEHKMSVEHSNNNKPSSSSQKQKQKQLNAHLHYGEPILKQKKDEYRRDRSRSHSKKKKKQRSKDRRDSREKQREREKERRYNDGDRYRQKQHRGDKQRDRDHRKQRDYEQKYKQKESRDHKDKQRQKDRDHKKKHKKDRSRSKSYEKEREKKHSNWG